MIYKTDITALVAIVRAGARAARAAAANRCGATDALWELVDETVTSPCNCTPDLFCNPSVSGAESGGRPRIRFRSRLRN